jgi:hypothetical protein
MMAPIAPPTVAPTEGPLPLLDDLSSCELVLPFSGTTWLDAGFEATDDGLGSEAGDVASEGDSVGSRLGTEVAVTMRAGVVARTGVLVGEDVTGAFEGDEVSGAFEGGLVTGVFVGAATGDHVIGAGVGMAVTNGSTHVSRKLDTFVLIYI